VSDERSSGSVLAALRALGAPVPAVLLRDGGAEHTPVTIGRGEAAQAPERYHVLGEIARGGVGIVFKGRDIDLGRDVAMKVIRPEHSTNADVVRRFVEEAQIGGQLQHPGIVPVYELGLQKDRRVYFTMKLVKGRTLAALLLDRRSPEDGRRRLLRIFEQVCQTVAYAHSRGVLHRDLKPSNVMVGAFGEVQVFDWGFAKVLGRKEEGPGEEAVRTVRSGPAGEESRVGSVMGTPAYMPPEQALGEIGQLDERADVFALGAILCEILTGRPPYVPESGELLVQAAQRRVGDALARLDRCATDAELVDLARACLGERGQRPRDAGVVADRLGAYLARVEERARGAELAATEARVQAREERRRRRLTLVAAAAILLTLVVAGAAWGWLEKDRRARALTRTLTVRDALAAARTRAAAARDRDGWDMARDAARAAARTARQLGTADDRAEAAALCVAADRAAEALARRETLLARLRELALQRVDVASNVHLARAYHDALRRYGIDLAALTDEEIVRRIRESDVASELVAALSDWAFALGGLAAERPAEAARLVALTAAADPDNLRNRLWQARLAADAGALHELAATDDPALYDGLSPGLLAAGLVCAGEREAALDFLRDAARRRPDNLVANRLLAMLLEAQRPPLREEALAYWRAALAAAPGSADTRRRLARALLASGEEGPAARTLEPLVADAPALSDVQELVAAYGRAGELEGRLEDWARAAVDRPGDPGLALRIGCAESLLGQDDRALQTFETALGGRPGDARLHAGKGATLMRAGRFVDAAEAWRRATDLDPENAGNWIGLSYALDRAGRREEALAAAETAFVHKADTRAALRRASVLASLGRLDEAIAKLQELLRMAPGDPDALAALLPVLQRAGRWEEAVAPARALLETGTRDPDVLLTAALTLSHEGEFADARTALARLPSLAPGAALAEARRLRDRCDLALAAEPALEAVLAGRRAPADGAEATGLAIICLARKRYAAAARLNEIAFRLDPARDTRRARYDAACQALKAAAGLGRDGAGLDDTERAALRGMALRWMRRNLAEWEEELARAPESAARARTALAWWQTDADLATVAGDALAALPPAERADWEAWWRAVRALLEKLEGEER